MVERDGGEGSARRGGPWTVCRFPVSRAGGSFFATTDAAGVAGFNNAGGGCIQLASAAIPGARNFAAELFAAGVKMREGGVVSPISDDRAGESLLR